MRIAIVGSGVSGLVAARLLAEAHDVVVFEASERVGGHVNTISVSRGDDELSVDTGFIVYNSRTYPLFTRMLRDLGVSSVDAPMSFSVSCDRTGLEYNGSSFNGLFAQRRNLLRLRFQKMLRDILRFNREGPVDHEIISDDVTVGEYVAQKRFSNEFAQHYLLPMGAAIWSCPFSAFEQFPVKFILEFYINHGLLSLRDRPQWRVIKGGSKTYVDRLIRPFQSFIRTACPVRSVRRHDNYVAVSHSDGTEHFDEIVLACHSDQALKLLEDPDPLERELLSAFPYSKSSAVLHTDVSRLPRRRRAWAAWNYRIPSTCESRPTLTYNMNILQGIVSRDTYCVTLNEDDAIAPDTIIAKFKYSHPLFTTDRAKIQERHHEVIRRRRTSYCGAYWRNGFHEDGVVSAVAVCRKFGIERWTDDDARSLRKNRTACHSSALTGTNV
ncbi:MAG: FAD-dependent oxidoreductase [Planctomycetales bacterium]|nr:FAD-dependent oxidoreductase [Planctomycetales bacterium]